MILPIVAYGDPVLRKECKDIDADYPNLKELIVNMKETMYNASGVGLAAPQIAKAIRLFLIDASPFAEDEDLDEADRETLKTFNKVFINAQILEEEGEEWAFNEGCLSIPDGRQDVLRQPKVTIEYQDDDPKTHTEVQNVYQQSFQHEFDPLQVSPYGPNTLL